MIKVTDTQRSGKEMKILLTIILTALITWGASCVFYTFKIRIDRTIHYSDVVRPLQVALAEIQGEIEEGSPEIAKLKIELLSNQVNQLGVEITENHLNSIIGAYRDLDKHGQTGPEPVR